jgi:sec-independent protein translocase protein TatA
MRRSPTRRARGASSLGEISDRYSPGVPFGLGIWEIVILVVILLLLFGGKGLPGAARKLGSSVREVKDAVGEMDPRGILDPKDEPKQVTTAPPPAALPAAAPAPASAPVEQPVAAPQSESEPGA